MDAHGEIGSGSKYAVSAVRGSSRRRQFRGEQECKQGRRDARRRPRMSGPFCLARLTAVEVSKSAGATSGVRLGRWTGVSSPRGRVLWSFWCSFSSGWAVAERDEKVPTGPVFPRTELSCCSSAGFYINCSSARCSAQHKTYRNPIYRIRNNPA